MAFYDTTWYISSVKYAAVTARPQNAAVAAGALVRQFTAPAVNSERVFVCIVAGTTANTTDATWTLARGAKVTDGTATWQECTGAAAVNGDAVNVRTWSQVFGTFISQGQIIKRDSGTSYHIATVSGTPSGAAPAFSDVAGSTSNDNGVNWTSLGVIGNFPAWGAPHARLANAYATNWGVAGNKFWIADNHAETQTTSMSLNSPATTAGGPTYAICVDRTAALPPVEANYNTGASISTTGSTNITLSVSISAGNIYYQGIAFKASDAAGIGVISINGNGVNYTFRNCAFAIMGQASGDIVIGSANTTILWNNCTVQFTAVGQHIRVNAATFEWRNTPSAIQGSVFPTALFSASYANSTVVCRGVDFSAFSGTLIGASFSSSNEPSPMVFEDCKFNASMTRYQTTTYFGASPLITVRCDS